MHTFLASAARTQSGTLVHPANFSRLEHAIFNLILSAAATEVGDTLDVFLQESMDYAGVEGDATWNDFAHFTQMLGNGGAKKFRAVWQSNVTPETEQGAIQDGAMAAGVRQGPLGPTWRTKWVIVDAGTANASFTFGIDYEGRRRPR